MVIATPPAGVTATVHITGPGNYSIVTHTTLTMTGLAPGQYIVTAATDSTMGTIIGPMKDSATVTGSPAAVAGGRADTMRVTYGTPSLAGGLWVANDIALTGFVELGATTLGASSTAPSTLRAFAQPGLDGPKAMAFDPSGNLWIALTRTPVVDTVLPAIYEYTAAQLDSSNPTPHLSLADSSMTLVGGLAFDSAGDLWVASGDNCEVVEYLASQLASASGAMSLSPALKITQHCQAPVVGPYTLSFDVAGNLWVGDLGSHTIYEFNRFRLTGTGTVTLAPSEVLQLPDTLMMPSAIAFDAGVDLWAVANDSTVFGYTPGGEATGAGGSSMRLVISGATLVSLAFDNSGDLWLADFHRNALYELSAEQMHTNGDVTPATVITGGQNVFALPTGLAFTPRVSGLPLFTRRR